VLREYGIGLQVGYQFTVRDRFVVDLMFFGPRRATNRLNLDLESDYAEEVIELLEEELNNLLDNVGIDPVSLTVSTEPRFNFGFNYFRYGISIGYKF
jgi:hypothetical protein